jgi:hypothetical protein
MHQSISSRRRLLKLTLYSSRNTKTH